MSSINAAASFFVAVELDGDGAHPAAWRAADHTPAELLTARRVRNTVDAAERYGFSAATFAGSVLPPTAGQNILGRLDPVQLAAFAAPLTRSLGLVPIIDALHNEPFHVATQLASLDHASDGRAGWLVSAPSDAAAAATVGAAPITDREQRLAETVDAIEVARRLWDSWEDDAVIRDVATGRYLDRDKLHHINFEGQRYSITGPAIVPRPPQGQLPVFAAVGDAVPGLADVVLVSAPDLHSARASAEDARSNGAAKVVLDVEIALDTQGRSATDRIDWLNSHTPWPSSGRLRILGSVAQLVEVLTELSTFSDGVRLLPAVLDLDVAELGSTVLPALAEAGIHRRPAAGDTLRATLGLPIAKNRYAPHE